MKKRIIALILALSILLPCILTSCNNTDGGDVDTDADIDISDSGGNSQTVAKNLIEINEEFVIAYNPYVVAERSLAKSFASDFKKKYGLDIQTKDFTSATSEYEIKIGTLTTRPEYISALEVMNEYATPGIAVGLIRATEGGLLITGSTSDAISVAIDYAYTNVFGVSAAFEAETDELIIFDSRAYAERREIIGYSLADIASFADVYSFSVNGSLLEGFDSNTYEYICNVTFAEGYPEISVTPLSKKAVVTYDPPTDANNGIATVTVTSEDGNNKNVYTVNVNMNYTYSTNAEIVHKGGKSAVVSFVIDDGGQSTATFVTDKMFKQFPSLTATFAVKAKDLATVKIVYDNNGEEAYAVDINGNYDYTPNAANVEYWKKVIATGRADVVSHSYSHTYWGENDDGGSFVYTKNDGTTATSRIFPRGTVTMELKASAQIVRELLGTGSYTYVKPGVGAKLSQYYFDLLESCGAYIGARSTNASPNAPTSMLNYVTDFKDIAKRFNVKSYMIEHYATSARKKTDIDSDPVDCLTADIDYWTDYIDAAVARNAFACFCIHDIEANNYVGSNHHIYRAQAEQLFAYACERDDVWVATFDQAVIYYSEWSTAELEAIAYKNESITVRLTDKENDAVYNQPLTVKLDVPTEWESVSVTQGVSVVEYTVMHSGSGSYVYVDVVPDGGDALVKPIEAAE